MLYKQSLQTMFTYKIFNKNKKGGKKMNVLQVKTFHNTIASIKEREAIERWKKEDSCFGYPVSTMYYFYRTDNNGNYTTLRRNGYVAFNKSGFCWGRNKQEAIDKFNRAKITKTRPL